MLRRPASEARKAALGAPPRPVAARDIPARQHPTGDGDRNDEYLRGAGLDSP